MRSCNILVKQETQYKFKISDCNEITISHDFNERLIRPTTELTLEVEEGELKPSEILVRDNYNTNGVSSVFNGNDIKYINDRKIVISGFDYKLFLSKNIILVFDQKINSNVILTTKALNRLIIMSDGDMGFKIVEEQLRKIN